jgi:hypothetical protein
MTTRLEIHKSKEYRLIADFYGERRAERSGVALLHHIDEGLEFLAEQLASENAMLAFCLHPIVQNNELIDVAWSSASLLALEYSQRANAYLCKPETDHVRTLDDVRELVGPMTHDCLLMLLADKRQNQKDFIEHHRGTHSRSQELDRYFNLWLAYIHMELSK